MSLVRCACRVQKDRDIYVVRHPKALLCPRHPLARPLRVPEANVTIHQRKKRSLMLANMLQLLALHQSQLLETLVDEPVVRKRPVDRPNRSDQGKVHDTLAACVRCRSVHTGDAGAHEPPEQLYSKDS